MENNFISILSHLKKEVYESLHKLAAEKGIAEDWLFQWGAREAISKMKAGEEFDFDLDDYYKIDGEIHKRSIEHYRKYSQQEKARAKKREKTEARKATEKQ